MKSRKGFHTDIAVWAAKHAYQEVRADGKMYSTGDRLRLDRFREHKLEMGFFVFVLLLGLIYAWRKGVLRWV